MVKNFNGYFKKELKMIVEKKKVLITGIFGQDGWFLTNLLKKKNYSIFGIFNKKKNYKDVENSIYNNVTLIDVNKLNNNSLLSLIKQNSFDEVYHLAANATPDFDKSIDFKIFDDNINFFKNLMYNLVNFSPKTRVFNASSSLIFGSPKEYPQNESTEINPNTPYGIAKATSFLFTKMLREKYDFYSVSGILYNHESHRRKLNFLPKIITYNLKKIVIENKKKIIIDNLNSVRDWSYAEDIVEGMWLMLQNDNPEDFVLGSGKLNSVRDFLEIAFKEVGLNWEKYVFEEEQQKRSENQIPYLANINKAKKLLNWYPKTDFISLVKLLVKKEFE